MPQCRWSQSLGELEATHQEIWGTTNYESRYEPTVFFGLYDLRDYIALWRHKGKAWVLWAGSDIRNLRSNFIFNDGKLLWLSQLFANFGNSFRDWLVRNVLYKAEHWVENEAEAWSLKDIGLTVSIGPSFLGNIKNYKVCYKPGNRVYLNCPTGREDEYGYSIVETIASSCPNIEFHIYGTSKQPIQPQENIFIHGRVPKKVMNREIKKMQCGLRLNKHDGFSEITAKSILWGQYPVTYLYNPMVFQFAADNVGWTNTLKNLNRLTKFLNHLPKIKEPNLKARNYYLRNLNAYPWNTKKHRMVAKA